MLFRHPLPNPMASDVTWFCIIRDYLKFIIIDPANFRSQKTSSNELMLLS